MCEADKLGSWHPFPSFPTPELEEFLTRLACGAEVEARAGAEAALVH